MTAWGSFALEVPNLNFRSFSFVSVEKVYSRDSEDCDSQPDRGMEKLPLTILKRYQEASRGRTCVSVGQLRRARSEKAWRSRPRKSRLE